MAKLHEDGYVIHVGNEEYRVSDDFAECLICLLKYGDTSNVILTTKTAIQDEKMKLLSDIHSLSIEKEKLKEELEFVRGDNTKFEEDVKQLKNDLDESQRNNMELAAENRRLHRWFAVLDLDNFIKEGVRERCFKLQAENEELKTQSSSLQKENVRLAEEREDLQKKNEYLSGSIKKICDIHAKEKAELKEQLEASSDLNMTNELANIFAEYTVADKKNMDDLGDKITEFRRKYGLE